MDEFFGFTASKNSEIQAAWYELAIKSGYYQNIVSVIEKFLIAVGRRKFLTPLYKALKNAGDVDTARKIYQQARPNYHFVAVQTMDELLDWNMEV